MLWWTRLQRLHAELAFKWNCVGLEDQDAECFSLGGDYVEEDAAVQLRCEEKRSIIGNFEEAQQRCMRSTGSVRRG